MKTKAYLLAIACLLMSGTAAFGQVSGFLPNQYDFTPSDLFRLSETGTQFGTARSVAMGSAFTSLGADISSMHINPAGLGMYQGSEFSITPMMTFSKVNSKNLDGYISNGSNNKRRFSIGNIGGAMNLYEGAGALTSFTLGVGYNRLADFNTNNRYEIGYNGNSIAHAWMMQLDGDSPGNLDMSYYRNFDRGRWGALMAFKSGLVEPHKTESNLYEAYAIGGGDIFHGLNIKSIGSIGEYNVSGGFNFQNKLYFGFSIGIQDYFFRQNVYYDEKYDGNGAYPAALAMEYDQYAKITGSGVNLKAGFIYRPINSLRIGFAAHTPTWSNITHSYRGSLFMEYEDGDNFNETPYDEGDYNISTPAKIMGGVSYTIGDVAIISTDYERAWYNSMRYRSDDGRYKSEFNAYVKEAFKATNTFRIGAEVRPTDMLSLRAGYTYATSPVDLDLSRDTYDAPVTNGYYNITAGIGYRIGRYTSLDLAYVFNQTKYSTYFPYYYKTEYNNVESFWAGEINQKVKRNTILLTLGFRF